MTVIPDRLPVIDGLKLLAGAHDYDPGKPPTEQEMCIMEAVAWVAGEPWSDHPRCASPVLGAFMRRWNDDLDDEGRQALKPYITRLVGSKGTAEQEDQRGWMAADWLVHTWLPLWLRAAELEEQAVACEALPKIDNRAAWLGSRTTLRSIRDVTWPRRQKLYDTICTKVRAAVEAELKRRGHEEADAVAAVAADAVAADAVAAVAVAAVAVAAVAVAAVAVAAVAVAADAVAVAAVAVAADAVAAVAVAAVAVAAVAVAADADAVAADAVAADAVAAVAADADAVAADAVAAVAVDAVDLYGPRYWAIRAAVREKVKPIIKAKIEEKLGAELQGAQASAVDLLERMLAVTGS